MGRTRMGRTDGLTDGRTRRRLYAPTKFLGEHKNPCQSLNSNPGPLATQSGGLPLDYRDNLTYRLKSNYFLVMGRSINTVNQAKISANIFFYKSFF